MCYVYITGMLVSVIYYLCLVKSSKVLLLMMIEGPEHGLAYAFETLTNSRIL